MCFSSEVLKNKESDAIRGFIRREFKLVYFVILAVSLNRNLACDLAKQVFLDLDSDIRTDPNRFRLVKIVQSALALARSSDPVDADYKPFIALRRVLSLNELLLLLLYFKFHKSKLFICRTLGIDSRDFRAIKKCAVRKSAKCLEVDEFWKEK